MGRSGWWFGNGRSPTATEMEENDGLNMVCIGTLDHLNPALFDTYTLNRNKGK